MKKPDLLRALATTLFFLVASATAGLAQGTFDGCGTVVPGVTCSKLFQPDSGGLYVVGGLSSFQVGDHVHVTGTIDPSCITICQQGNGCIDQSTVTSCEVGTAFCFGDGTQGNCPCGNNGAAGHGCNNSAMTAGSVLLVNGTTSPDTLVLSAHEELPNTTSIFLQGTMDLGSPVSFGDGLRCTGGLLKRIAVKVANAGGSVMYPQGGDPAISQQSSSLGDPIAPGSTRYYQVYYRDSNLAFCPPPSGNSWNVSNGLAIVW